MNGTSLQCVGRPSEVSSKVSEKEGPLLKLLIGSSTDPAAKESVEWKPKQQKTKFNETTEEQHPTKLKASSSTRQQKPKPNETTEQHPTKSETTKLKASSSTRQTKPKLNKTTEEQHPIKSETTTKLTASSSTRQPKPKSYERTKELHPSITSETTNMKLKALSSLRQQKPQPNETTEEQHPIKSETTTKLKDSSSTTQQKPQPNETTEEQHRMKSETTTKLKDSSSTRQQKPQPNETTEEQHSSTNSETTNTKLKASSSTRPQKQQSSGKKDGPDSLTQNPFQKPETSNPTLKVHSSNSRGYNAPKAPSFRNVTTHGHKPPNHLMTGECEVKSENIHEPHIQGPQEAISANDQDPPEAQSDEDENKSTEAHVPLELIAEFLQAVMTKNYQLAKKLCQMILIYEPHNSEAMNFLPLIEEKLLIEADDGSDDGDDGDESDTSDDDSDDDDESSDSSDTDEESSDSTDDTLSSSS